VTPTIKEVAKKAQVSTATVSRVLNKSGLVDEETRKIVLAAARELRYVPNATGRSLSMQRTDAIGLLMPDLYGEFFSEVIRGTDQAAQKNHFHILVSSSHNARHEIWRALEIMRGRVDGLIVMSPHIDAQTLDSHLPKSLPVVLLNCYVEGASFDVLNIDNFNGACRMMAHLAQHGYKRIAFINGTEKNYDAEERLRGYRAAVDEYGLEHYSCYEAKGNFSEESGYDAARIIMKCSPRPRAIFAANDSMAIGALSALRQQSVNVPADIALVGFDDIPIAQFIRPALSSVRVRISELGRLAIERIVHAIKEKNTHEKQRIIVPTTLIARESCGCTGANALIF
jgi:LacI family transcriptional regulator